MRFTNVVMASNICSIFKDIILLHSLIIQFYKLTSHFICLGHLGSWKG
jgi:hypothetical protein